MSQNSAQENDSAKKKRNTKKKVGEQPMREKRRYAEITIAALTGEISAEHLYDPPTRPDRGNTSRIWSLDDVLKDLADGGYVFDLRPLAENPNIYSWVVRSPLPSGRIDGDEIDRFSDDARRFAGEMAHAFEGDFQGLAFLASERHGEPLDGSAGPFDSVSAAYRAVYWGRRGALIGKRVGDLLCWSDGRQQAIGSGAQEL